MAFTLGRTRNDIAGSQNSALNSAKVLKTKLPKFKGKNADELNQLAEFIEQNFQNSSKYGKDLTSKNTDAIFERLHQAMMKLKEASDSDNDTECEQIKADIIEQLKAAITDTSSSKEPTETIWSEDDKKYLEDLIAASTLTEATEKTEDQSGQNGLTKDDIDKALDKTIEEQKILNNNVVEAAEEANEKVTDVEPPEDVKGELQEMFAENAPDNSDVDALAAGNADQMQKLQDMISGQVGTLNNHIKILGDNFKGSEIFNYKNPFASSVGKIPSVVDRIGDMMHEMYDAIQYGLTSTAENISQTVSDTVTAAEEKKNQTLSDKIKGGIILVLAKVIGGIFKVVKFIGFLIFKAIAGIFKFIASKFSKGKPKKKEKKDSSLLNLLKKPKPVQLTWNTVKSIGQYTADLVNKKKKKKKKKGFGFMNKITAVIPPLSSKEKKDKKKKDGIFKKIGDFFKNIGKAFGMLIKGFIQAICESMVLLANAAAKCIGIILRAIFLNPYGLIILASLLLIAIGILLIGLAVKKLVDYIVDDLGPIIKEKLKQIDAQALNKFVNSVSTFIETFTSILAGAFAPIIAIGTIIKNIIAPAGKLIKKLAEVVCDILLPIIEFIGKMVKIILVPIMKVLEIIIKAVVKVIMAILPAIQIIIDIIAGIIIKIVKCIIVPLWKLFEAILIPVIKVIEGIIKVIMAIVQPIFDIISGVILGILEVIGELVKVFAPIIKEVVGVVIKGVVFAIKKAIDFIGGIIKGIWNFLCHPINFIMKMIKGVGNWLAGFADIEIGFWKFKFKPLGFLKGLKSEGVDEDEPLVPDDGKSKEMIENLSKQLKELKAAYKKSEDNVKILSDKLKEAESVKIEKRDVLQMIFCIKMMWKALATKVAPAMVKIALALVGIALFMKGVTLSLLAMAASLAISSIFSFGKKKDKDEFKENTTAKLDELVGITNAIKEKVCKDDENKLGKFIMFGIMKGVLLIAKGVTKLVGYAADVVDCFSGINEKLDKILDKVSDSGGGTLLKLMVFGILKGVKFICEIMAKIYDSLKDLGSKFIDICGQIKDVIAESISNVVDAIKDLFGDVGDSLKFIKNNFVIALNRITDMIRDIKKSFVDSIKSVKDTIVDLIKNRKNEAPAQEQKQEKKMGFFERLRAKMQEKIGAVASKAFGKASSVMNKVAGSISGPVKGIMKFTPFGFLGSMAKKAVNFATEKTGLKLEKPKLDITQESAKNQFSSINSINNQGKEDQKKLAEGLTDANNNARKKNDDITNMDLKTFLAKMFEDVNISFAKISEKLDKPQVMPLSLPMQLNNQALIGAQQTI